MKVKLVKLKYCIENILKLKEQSISEMKSIIEQELKRGKVYIASMNMRGKWAEKPENTTIINVTSMQGKDNKNRRDFSPMTEYNYRGFYNFEAFWQSGKVYEGIPVEKTIKFWKSIKEPKRRYPGSKGKKVLYAKWDDEKFNYIESRKKVYIPLYYEMIKDREMTLYWKKKVEEGKDVIIYDFDGPRLDDGSVTCHKVTLDFVKEKLNDPKFPFGHGYIIASIFAGIDPKLIN